MDADWQPMQGSGPAAAAGGGVDPNAPAQGDWRAKLQPEARSRIVSKILEHLKRLLLAARPEGLNELQRFAVRLEDRAYTAATSQSGYLRKISLTIHAVETRIKQAPRNVQVIPNQRNAGRASASSTAQTCHPGEADWQEEIYQKIKSLKDQHFAELSLLFNQISLKIQRFDSIIPPQDPSELYKKMKISKILLDHVLQLLITSKSSIQPSTGDEIRQYEEQIISISTRSRAARTRFQPPAGQAPIPNMFQQRQLPSPLLSSMSTGLQSSNAAVFRHVPAPPTTNFSVYAQRNGADIQQEAGSSMESAQGSNFNSLQYGLMDGALQQGSIAGLMQGTMTTSQDSTGLIRFQKRARTVSQL